MKNKNTKTSSDKNVKTTKLTSKDYPIQKTLVKKPVKGVKWGQTEPKGMERIQLNKVCPKCILIKPTTTQKTTEKNNPKNYKFPICSKLSKNKSCQLNCTGLLAANRRARLTKIYPKVQKLTGQLLQKFKCTKASIDRDRKKLLEKQKKIGEKKNNPKQKPAKPNKK